jgi:cyclic pyranopterin phosphate synthase
MWDVSSKEPTARTATASAFLRMEPATVAAVLGGTVPKGDPLPVAKVAAIQAAKNTPSIIPYCHPVGLEHVGVEFQIREAGIEVSVTVKTSGKTGVEMEALTAASVGALTLYDMLKQIDVEMSIERVELVQKRGGKSDYSRGRRSGVVVDDGQGETS